MAFNFNEIAQDFKNLNPKDPGTWPAAPKLVTLLVVVAVLPFIGYFVDTQVQIEELERGREQEVKLKQEYLDKKKQAINLDLHRAQLREIYAELPITVKVVGNYHDMGAFASDVGQLSRIVTLNDIAIAAGKDGILTMDATARTFRYLDDEEVAAQRRAAKGAAKK